MNAQNPKTARQTSTTETVNEAASEVKDETVSRLSRIKNNSKPKLEKLKTAAAVVGTVSILGVAAATIAKKKSAKVEVTLPDLDVTTTDV